MKKILTLAAAAMVLCAPSLHAQQSTINEKSILNKIERSDADIANPKKSGKSATWLNRGKTFFEAATAVSTHLYEGMTPDDVILAIGQPVNAEEVMIGNDRYQKIVFPYADIYIDQAGIPTTWEVTRDIYPGALDKAVEAYVKAYEIDGAGSRTAEKVNEGLKAVYDEYSKSGASYYMLQKYDRSGDMFVKAIELASLPQLTVDASSVNTLMHDAGLAYYFAGDYDNSVKYLVMAEANGYDEAEIYYLIYHAYRGTASENPDALVTAKGYLEKGLAKYPSDKSIIESLSEAYVLLKEDPGQIISVVRASVEENPGDPNMWSALGVLYSSQNDYDGAIEAFLHMAELAPDNFIAFNNLGIIQIQKAEAILAEANAKAGTLSSQAEYDAEKNRAYDEYVKSVPYLERALEIDPTSVPTLSLLKEVTFRVRDRKGMMEKYQKYNEMLKAVNK